MQTSVPDNFQQRRLDEINQQFARYEEILKLKLSTSQYNRLKDEFAKKATIAGYADNIWFLRSDAKDVPTTVREHLLRKKEAIQKHFQEVEAELKEENSQAESLLQSIEKASAKANYEESLYYYDNAMAEFERFKKRAGEEKNNFSRYLSEVKALQQLLDSNKKPKEREIQEYSEQLKNIKQQFDEFAGLAERIQEMIVGSQKRYLAYQTLKGKTTQDLRELVQKIGDLQQNVEGFFKTRKYEFTQGNEDLKLYHTFQQAVVNAESRLGSALGTIEKRKQDAKELVDDFKRFHAILNLMKRAQRLQKANEAVNGPDTLNSAAHEYLTVLTQERDFKRVEARLTEFKNRFNALEEGDIKQEEKINLTSALNISLNLVTDPEEREIPSGELQIKMTNISKELQEGLQKKLPEIISLLERLEKEAPLLLEEANKYMEDEKSLSTNEKLNQYEEFRQKLVEMIAKLTKGVQFPERPLLSMYREIRLIEKGKEDPLYEQVDGLIVRVDKLQSTLQKKSYNLSRTKNLVTTKFETALRNEVSQIETDLNFRLKNAAMLGDFCYLSGDETLKTSGQWQSLLTYKKDTLSEVARLKEMQAKFEVTVIQNDLENKLNLMTEESMPLSKTVMRQKNLVQAFSGFENHLLVKMLIKNQLKMKAEATVQQLNAINAAVRTAVSDSTLKKRLDAVGLEFTAAEIQKINRVNKQMRYRDALQNKVLRDHIIQNNIYLKSTVRKLIWNTTRDQIEKINQSMHHATSRDELRALLATIGLTKIPQGDFDNIYEENVTRYWQNVDLKKAPQEKVISEEDIPIELLLPRKAPQYMDDKHTLATNTSAIEETTPLIEPSLASPAKEAGKVYRDDRAIQVQVERLQHALDALDLSEAALYAMTIAEQDSVMARLQNDHESAGLLQSKFSVNSQQYLQLEDIKKELIERLEKLLAFKPFADKLILTTDPKDKFMINETVVTHYYLQDKETLEDAYYDRETPYEFYFNNAHTISYQLRPDRSMSLYDHQLQEVITHHIFNPENKNKETLGNLSPRANEAGPEKLPYYIYGPAKQALEMAKKLYMNMPRYRRADAKIYINDKLVEQAQLVSGYEMGFFMKRNFRTGRAFRVESPSRDMDEHPRNII